jgi:hypothetical protein
MQLFELVNPPNVCKLGSSGEHGPNFILLVQPTFAFEITVFIFPNLPSDIEGRPSSIIESRQKFQLSASRRAVGPRDIEVPKTSDIPPRQSRLAAGAEFRGVRPVASTRSTLIEKRPVLRVSRN